VAGFGGSYNSATYNGRTYNGRAQAKSVGGAFGSATFAGRAFAGDRKPRGPVVLGGGYAAATYGGRTYGGAKQYISGPLQTKTMQGLASAQALGQPTVRYDQTIAVAGVVSGFVAGLYHTSLTVPIGGVATSEAEGRPTVIQVQYINISAQASSFAAGLYSTSLTVPIGGIAPGAPGAFRVNVTVPMLGAAPSEAVAAPVVAQSIPARGIPSSEATGLFSTSVTVPMAAGFSAEQFGRPPPPAQLLRPLLAAASAESVGQPIVGDFKLIGSALSAEAGGRPTVVPGPVIVHMLGEVLTVFGRPSIAVTVLLVGIPSLEAVSQVLPVRAQHHDMQGAVSAEAFGQPIVPVRPTSAASGESVGRPLVSVARTIAMQGAPSSETVPAASVGAIIVMQGAASAASVTDLPLVPVGIASAFAAGGFTFYVPPQDQTLSGRGRGWRRGLRRLAGDRRCHRRSRRRDRRSVRPGPHRPSTPHGWRRFRRSRRPPIDEHLHRAHVARRLRRGGGPAELPEPPNRACGDGCGERRDVRRAQLDARHRHLPARRSHRRGAPRPHLRLRRRQSRHAGRGQRGRRRSRPLRAGRLPRRRRQQRSVRSARHAAVGQPPRARLRRGGRQTRPADRRGDVRQPRGRGKRGTHRRVPGADDPGGRSELGGVRPANGRSFHQPSWGRLLERVRPAAGRPDRAHRRVASSEAVGQPGTQLSVPLVGTPSGEAFGAVWVAYQQFITPTGIDTSEQLGGLLVHVTARAASAVSLEAFGLPRVVPLAYLRPGGADSAEQVSAPKINRTIPMAGAATGAAFGLLRASPGEVRVPMWGIAEYPFEPHTPHDKYGEPLITTWVLGGVLAGVPSAENLGRPRQAAQAVHPAGVASAEQFGQPTAPAQRLRLAGAVTAERVSRFWQTAATSRDMLGIPSVEHVGAVAVPSQTLHPAGLPGGMVGTPRVNVLERAQGAGTSERFGFPTTVQAVSPSGITSASSVGAPLPPLVSVRLGSVGSAENVGRFSTPLTVPIAPAGAGESTGQFTVHAVYVVRPGPVPPWALWGGPVISTVVRLGLVGIESGEAAAVPTVLLVFTVGLLGWDSAALGDPWISQYPTTGVWVDTDVSGVAQMLDANGRSLSVGVLAITQGIIFSGNVGVATGLLLGATLPVGSQPTNITAGDGIGIRYTGAADLVPVTVEFVIDGSTEPVDELLFWHEDTETFGAPWTALDIYWITPVGLPDGLHTATVAVSDINGRTDSRTWQFTSTGSNPGGPT
jgi:hypothetical protein